MPKKERKLKNVYFDKVRMIDNCEYVTISENCVQAAFTEHYAEGTTATVFTFGSYQRPVAFHTQLFWLTNFKVYLNSFRYLNVQQSSYATTLSVQVISRLVFIIHAIIVI